MALTLDGGLIQPFLKVNLAESRVIAWNQRTLAKFGPEISRVGVDDNVARVVTRAESLADQVVEAELFRAATSTVPFTGAPTAARPSAFATSSAAIG